MPKHFLAAQTESVCQRAREKEHNAAKRAGRWPDFEFCNITIVALILEAMEGALSPSAIGPHAASSAIRRQSHSKMSGACSMRFEDGNALSSALAASSPSRRSYRLESGEYPLDSIRPNTRCAFYDRVNIGHHPDIISRISVPNTALFGFCEHQEIKMKI